jgi:hypothetical protein
MRVANMMLQYIVLVLNAKKRFIIVNFDGT